MKNWKKNTIYISAMQLTLLVVNFFLITIISRNYGAEIYGEYASSKSLSVLIGTCSVFSLALVVTKLLAQKNKFSKYIFQNAYWLILRNFFVALVLLIPITFIFKRNLTFTSLLLMVFIINELLHVALAFFQARSDFVTSSKQILIRTVIYGSGAWVLISQGFSIITIIIFQIINLLLFFLIANRSIPKDEIIFNFETESEVKNNLQNSGKKMVLTTFSSALVSELDIVLLGLFYSGSALGILAWSRRILEIIFQILAASMDIIFPELSKAKKTTQITQIRKTLRNVCAISFIVPILFFLMKDINKEIFITLLGPEFSDVSLNTTWILFSLPVMLWSRINIIFSRAQGFEIKLTKAILFGSAGSFIIYNFVHFLGYYPAVISIISSQALIAIATTYSFRKSNV
jgi:O-antigen/teichoic acid export membrane protein